MKKILVLCIVLSSLSIYAQEAEMAKLNSMIGTWENLSFEMGENGEWLKGTPSIARFQYVLGNRFIQEQTVYRGKNMTMTALIFTGYDVRQKKYKMTVMDQEYGVMDTYLGDFTAEGRLQLDNLNDAGFETSEGESLGFQLNWSLIDSTNMELVVKMTRDQGKSWINFNKVVYKKIN